MNWQSLISIIAASVGVAAGLWLCMGAALITPERIAKFDDILITHENSAFKYSR
jgi:hypothetical protein